MLSVKLIFSVKCNIMIAKYNLYFTSTNFLLQIRNNASIMCMLTKYEGHQNW